MVNSGLQWAWVRSGGSNHMNGGGEVLAGAPTQVDELRQPAAARRGSGRHAAPTRPRAWSHTRSPRQLRGSQFEYASSLSPAELVRNHHHHEVALRQREHRAARRSPTACGRLLRDEAAGEACGSCPTHRWGSCDPSLLMRLRENAPGSDRASPLRRVCGTWVASMPDCWAPAVLLLLVTNFQT
jgi:hypothetical protein